MMENKWLESIWLGYSGRIIGTLGGLFFGLIFLFVGFWKTVFFGLLIVIGFFLGSQMDKKEGIKDILDYILLDKWIRK